MKLFQGAGAWLLRSAMSLVLALPLFSSAATITYFHNDVSGTPLVATDASGAVVWKESYRPYGSKWNNAPGSNANAIGYTGRPYDANTGLSYMGARYYDPVLSRFMAIDPLSPQADELHSFNRYAYANNNPYKYVDPDGRFAQVLVRLEYALVYRIASNVGAPVVGSWLGLKVYDLLHPDPVFSENAPPKESAKRADSENKPKADGAKDAQKRRMSQTAVSRAR